MSENISPSPSDASPANNTPDSLGASATGIHTLLRFVDSAARAIGVHRVFGEQIETPAGSVIPVATVMGGQGVGFGDGARLASSEDADDADTPGPASDGAAPVQGSGGGGGFGVVGWPAGAYVTTGGQTRWQPAVDANVVILSAGLLAGAAITAVASISAIKTISATAVTLSGHGAETIAAISDAGARSVSALATTAGETTTALGEMARDSFATAASSASSTTLALANLGTQAFLDATALVTRSVSAGLDSLANSRPQKG